MRIIISFSRFPAIFLSYVIWSSASLFRRGLRCWGHACDGVHKKFLLFVHELLRIIYRQMSTDVERDCMLSLPESVRVTAIPRFRRCYGFEADMTHCRCARKGNGRGSSKFVFSHSNWFRQEQPRHTLTGIWAKFPCLCLQQELVALRYSLIEYFLKIDESVLSILIQRILNERRCGARCALYCRKHYFEGCGPRCCEYCCERSALTRFVEAHKCPQEFPFRFCRMCFPGLWSLSNLW